MQTVLSWASSITRSISPLVETTNNVMQVDNQIRTAGTPGFIISPFHSVVVCAIFSASFHMFLVSRELTWNWWRVSQNVASRKNSTFTPNDLFFGLRRIFLVLACRPLCLPFLYSVVEVSRRRAVCVIACAPPVRHMRVSPGLFVHIGGVPPRQLGLALRG